MTIKTYYGKENKEDLEIQEIDYHVCEICGEEHADSWGAVCCDEDCQYSHTMYRCPVCGDESYNYTDAEECMEKCVQLQVNKNENTI